MLGVTIGIPVYNEADILEPNVLRLLGFLDRLATPYEVLVGSNGSSDATVERGQNLAERFERVRFFDFAQRGVGPVFRRFVTEARYEALVSLDMDISTDLEFVPRALRLLESCDAVVGAKKMGSNRRPVLRRAVSDLFTVMARGFLGLEYEDYSMAAKAFRVSALEPHAGRILDGTGYVLQVLYLIQRAGGRIVQVPVDCEDHRPSKFNLVHEGFHKFLSLGRLWWELGGGKGPGGASPR